MANFGQEVKNIVYSSPLSYSTNEAVPFLPETMNRIIRIDLFGKTFNHKTFKYYANTDAVKNLSWILPNIIKKPFSEIKSLYDDCTEVLKICHPQAHPRMINNVAIAMTGTKILAEIGNIELNSFDEDCCKFLEESISDYETTETVVEKVLNKIYVLTQIGQLCEGQHYKIEDGIICFNKKVILSAINKYYAHNKTEQIDEKTFLEFAKNDDRYMHTKTVRINSNPVHAMSFNLKGLECFSGIYDESIMRANPPYIHTITPPPTGY